MRSIPLQLLLAAGISSMLACGNHEVTSTEPSGDPITVTVAEPATQSHSGIAFSGQVVAKQSAAISTRVMGTISAMLVKPGDRVHKGQVLIRINSDDLAARRQQADAMIAEAEAHLANARKDFDRFTNLYHSQSASAKELDNVTLQYKAAEARVDAARQMRKEVDAMMAYTTLTAPFDGSITQKMAEAGSMAAPGMPLLMIEGNGHFQVEAAVPETDISKIKLHEKAQVNIKSLNRQFMAVISEISPSSEMSGGQYIIKLDVPAASTAGLLAGMYANLSISAPAADDGEITGVLVPTAVLLHRDQLVGLYTISDNQTALLRWVRTGKAIGDQTEVLTGLSAGEKYIAGAEGKLYNGAPVKIKGAIP